MNAGLRPGVGEAAAQDTFVLGRSPVSTAQRAQHRARKRGRDQGQWAWRVWRAWERFQSLDRSARMVTEEVPTPLDGGLAGPWGLPPQGRGRSGTGVQ